MYCSSTSLFTLTAYFDDCLLLMGKTTASNIVYDPLSPQETNCICYLCTVFFSVSLPFGNYYSGNALNIFPMHFLFLKNFDKKVFVQKYNC